MSPSQDHFLPSTTKQPQDPLGRSSTLRQSPAPEGFGAKTAVKTPSEAPGSRRKANQRSPSESEQRGEGGGTGPGDEQQLQSPRRSDASVEMVVSSPERSEVTAKSGLISGSVMASGFASSSRSDATETILGGRGESHLLIIAPVSGETEESSIPGAAEDFKPHKDPDPTASAPPSHSSNTQGDVMLEGCETVSLKPQTSPQCADAGTEAGEVAVEDVHTRTLLENQHYDNATPAFKNSTQPSSDLSSDLMTGDSFFLSTSEPTQQTVESAHQPPTDTVTRKGAKLGHGVRGQRVRF